ncbi:hypothetical protein QYF36_001510 [Acer negundo]|nr:hypothetical protein QYF36_001510 [Acer negundo]
MVSFFSSETLCIRFTEKTQLPCSYQVLPGIGLLADKVPYGIRTGFSNSPNSPVRIFDERENASQEVVFNEEDLVVEFEDQGDVPTLVAIGVRLGGVRSGTSSTAHARGGSSLGVDVSSRIPFKQSKLLSAKKEKGVASRLITLLAHRVSFLPLKVVELKARIRRSHSLSSSSCAKLPSFVPASSSSTSTSFPASILLPKSALDKGKGIEENRLEEEKRMKFEKDVARLERAMVHLSKEKNDCDALVAREKKELA